MTIPTLTKMVKVYTESAAVERLKCGRPDEGTVRNTLAGVRQFKRWLNQRRAALGYETIPFDEDFPLVSIIKPPLVHKYLAEMLKRGLKPVTAMSYITQLQQLFARWVRPYYEDLGWRVPEFPALNGRPKAPRYVRPSLALLTSVKTWYNGLSSLGESDFFQGRKGLVPAREVWFAATMMLEFAMRNGDIMRLTPENFVCHEGRQYLNYTPHKTANSSARMVRWPIHPTIWERLSKGIPPLNAEVFNVLNKQIRGLGFTGTKGAYELRKICIDHVYQRFGAEMAVSISGDDIKTIIHYYADPSQPNIGDVRVTDLL